MRLLDACFLVSISELHHLFGAPVINTGMLELQSLQSSK
jgi:hypothetical protein